MQTMFNADAAKQIRTGGYEQIVAGATRTVAVSDDHKLRVFNSETGDLVNTIDLLADTIPKVVALNAAESYAFVGAQDGHLLAIDLVTEEVEVVTRGASEVTALATSVNEVLAVGFHSGEIALWSIGSTPAYRICSLTRMSNSINRLEFSQDGSQLAMQVQGEHVARLLDWQAFRDRLSEFGLDWD